MQHIILDGDDSEPKREDADSGRIDKYFFKSRNVIITGGIDDKLARRAVTHLLALAEENDDPISQATRPKRRCVEQTVRRRKWGL